MGSADSKIKNQQTYDLRKYFEATIPDLSQRPSLSTIGNIKVSPCENFIAIGSCSGILMLCDANTKTILKHFPTGRCSWSNTFAMDFSPDSKIIATMGDNGSPAAILLISTQTLEPVSYIPTPASGALQSCSFCPLSALPKSGKQEILCGGVGKNICVIELNVSTHDLSLRTTKKDDNPKITVEDSDKTDDMNRIIFSDANNSNNNNSDARHVAVLNVHNKSEVYSISYNKEGNKFLASCYNGNINIFSRIDDDPECRWLGVALITDVHSRACFSASFSSDGKIGTGCYDACGAIIDATTYQELICIKQGSYAHGSAWNSDSSFFAFGTASVTDAVLIDVNKMERVEDSDVKAALHVSADIYGVGFFKDVLLLGTSAGHFLHCIDLGMIRDKRYKSRAEVLLLCKEFSKKKNIRQLFDIYNVLRVVHMFVPNGAVKQTKIN